MQSLLVPAHVAAKIEKHLIRLAAKAGVAFARIPGETYLGDEEGRVPCARFTVSDIPRETGGWELVARLEHTPEGNIVSVFPGECVSSTWRTAPPVCDHCGTRRARRDTFVLRSPEGALRSIGRNCLADFLVEDPSRIVARAELAAIVRGPCDDECYGRGGGGWTPCTAEYLAHVCAAVRVEGFRKSDQDAPTKDAAFFSRGPRPSDSFESRMARKRWTELQPTDEDRAFAATLAAWRPEGKSDYEHNLRIALALPVVGRNAGLLASAPSAYARAAGAFLARPKAAAAVSEHFGAVGKRGFVLLRLMRVADVDTMYGTVSFLSFEDSAGRSFLWKASGSCPGQANVGDVFTGKATIKAHDEYKGRKQTVLSRFAWEPCAAPAEVAA